MKINLLLSVLLLSGICFSQSNNLGEKVSISLDKKENTVISADQQNFISDLENSPKKKVDGVVISVTIIADEYNVKYFDTVGKIQTVKYPISPSFVLKTNKSGYFSFSLLTVPFKIRPALGNTEQYVRADIKNLGLYFGP